MTRYVQMHLMGLLPTSNPWTQMFTTPRHKSAICLACHTTPQARPGTGWLRRGANLHTRQHLCPDCAGKRPLP